MQCYTANVTYLGNEAIKTLLRRPEHVVGVLETHLNGQAAEDAEKRFANAGWDLLHARAKPSATGKGSTGGALLLHKKSLQSAAPTESYGHGHRLLLSSNIAYKHFRISGLHFIPQTALLNGVLV